MNSKAYFLLLDHLNSKKDEHGIWLVGCMVNDHDPDHLERLPHFPPFEKKKAAGGSDRVASQFSRTGERAGQCGGLDCGNPLLWLLERGLLSGGDAISIGMDLWPYGFPATAEPSHWSWRTIMLNEDVNHENG